MTPDKDFFPDTWSENQVINAIKQAWENKAPAGGNKYDGTYNGITIRMFIEN